MDSCSFECEGGAAAAAEEGVASANKGFIGRGAAQVTWQNWLSFFACVVRFTSDTLFTTFRVGPTHFDLSLKYHTLLNPAGWAFNIWLLIIVGEGSWAVLQLFPFFAGRPGVRAVAPGWWACCLCQSLWTVAFALEVMWLALILMLMILGSLVFIVLSTEKLELTLCPHIYGYLLQRAPFAWHLGWIICATAVNINVLFDSFKVGPGALIAVAIATLAAIVLASAFFAMRIRAPEPMVPMAAGFALLAVFLELQTPDKLKGSYRGNPQDWTEYESGVRGVGWAALAAATLCGALAVLSVMLRFRGPAGQSSSESEAQA